MNRVINPFARARVHSDASATRKLGDYIELIVVILMFILGLLIVDRVNGQETPAPMTDEAILVNVEAALISNEAVNAYQVHVDVRNGVVTLSGTVDTLRARRQAVTAVGATPGVRRVVDRLTVRHSRRDDHRLRNEVTSALAQDLGVHPAAIQVSARSGRIILAGGAGSHAEKMLISQAAQSVRGVLELDNQMEAPVQLGMSDSSIANSIQSQLESHAWSEEGEIVVEVKDGYVTLKGGVATPEEKQAAGLMAWVEGVRGVNADQLDSRIPETAWAAEFAAELAAPMDRQTILREYLTQNDIVRALKCDPRVDLGDINVCVSNGVATLTGRVYTLSSRIAAEETTFRHPGIVKVVNQLRVAPPSPIDDSCILRDLARKMRLHPFIREKSVDVGVYGGVAILNGRVSSPAERLRAGDIANQTPGVVSVRNNLRIGRWLNLTDDELRQSVEDWLFWSKHVDPARIQVTASNGAVTLTGDAPSPVASQIAATRAYQAGAQTVVNQLLIAP